MWLAMHGCMEPVAVRGRGCMDPVSCGAVTVHNIVMQDTLGIGPGNMFPPSASFRHSLEALDPFMLDVYYDPSKQSRAGAGA